MTLMNCQCNGKLRMEVYEDGISFTCDCCDYARFELREEEV
jgi:hypothetical protein